MKTIICTVLVYILLWTIMEGCRESTVTFDQTNLEDCAKKFVEHAYRQNNMEVVYLLIKNPWPPAPPGRGSWFDKESFLEAVKDGRSRKYPNARITDIEYFDKFARVTIFLEHTMGPYYDYWIKEDEKWFKYHDRAGNWPEWISTMPSFSFLERYIENLNRFGSRSPEERDKTIVNEEEILKYLKMIVQYWDKEEPNDYPGVLLTSLGSNYLKVRYYCYEELKKKLGVDGGIGNEFISAGHYGEFLFGYDGSGLEWMKQWRKLVDESGE